MGHQGVGAALHSIPVGWQAVEVEGMEGMEEVSLQEVEEELHQVDAFPTQLILKPIHFYMATMLDYQVEEAMARLEVRRERLLLRREILLQVPT